MMSDDDQLAAPRRSCLVVPGSSDRMLAKAHTLPADELILDLEDAVAPNEKEAARARIVNTLQSLDANGRLRSVRINDMSGMYGLRDLLTVVGQAGPHIDSVVVPKVSTVREIHLVDGLLEQLEREQDLAPESVGIGVQIEDALGLLRIDEILGASERIVTVNFGPGDLSAALGIPTTSIGSPQPNYPGDHWHWVKFHLLVHARAHGIQVIDGPFGRVHDVEGFAESARVSHALGYDGKWVLHPSQVDSANEIFGVTHEEFARAHALLDAYRNATETQARGAVMFDGEMIDEASRQMAQRAFAKGRAQGVTLP